MIPSYVYEFIFLITLFSSIGLAVSYITRMPSTFSIYTYHCLKCGIYYETSFKIKLPLIGIYHKIFCRWVKWG